MPIPKNLSVACNAHHAELVKNDKFFIKCCELAGIPATKRQASKYRRQTGLAYAQWVKLAE